VGATERQDQEHRGGDPLHESSARSPKASSGNPREYNLLIPIGETARYGPLQAEWLALSVHTGPTWHGDYEVAACNFARFIKERVSWRFQEALRKELNG